VDVFTVQDRRTQGFIPGAPQPIFFEKFATSGNKITTTAVTSVVEL
jgi:hypothetical protein